MSDISSKLQDKTKMVKADRRAFLKGIGTAGAAIAALQTARLNPVGDLAYACSGMNGGTPVVMTVARGPKENQAVLAISPGVTFAAQPGQTCAASIGHISGDFIVGASQLLLVDSQGEPVTGFGEFTPNETLSSLLNATLNPLFGTKFELEFFAFTALIVEPGVKAGQEVSEVITLDLAEGATFEHAARSLRQSHLLVNGATTEGGEALRHHVTIVEAEVTLGKSK